MLISISVKALLCYDFIESPLPSLFVMMWNVYKMAIFIYLEFWLLCVLYHNYKCFPLHLVHVKPLSFHARCVGVLWYYIEIPPFICFVPAFDSCKRIICSCACPLWWSFYSITLWFFFVVIQWDYSLQVHCPCIWFIVVNTATLHQYNDDVFQHSPLPCLCGM